jgi:molybdopterin/thiamine biosynthesis adenylyltransferase
VQNIFSRNTGILESSIMKEKCAFILGCGSVGSLVALELARAGVGRFVLIDNDVLEYHNLCRHQCSIADVGEYKVYSVARRIREINPEAEVECVNRMVEEAGRNTFDACLRPGGAIFIGCADNRTADVYANSVAIAYGVPFVSIGFWERAFAGEIFYHLPGRDMPCYECAIGAGGELSQRQSSNRRFYTTQEDLANANFEPGISIDINFVTTIGVKLALDILNIGNGGFTPRLLGHLKQYTLVCNTNDPKIGGEMAEIFSYPLQVTTSLCVNYQLPCPPCRHLPKE